MNGHGVAFQNMTNNIFCLNKGLENDYDSRLNFEPPYVVRGYKCNV